MKWATLFIIALISTQIAIAGDRSYGERLKYRNAAVKGQVLMGMTEREVKRAVGSPVRINRSRGAYGTSDQWVYDKPGKPRYIYLDNGEVTAISD